MTKVSILTGCLAIALFIAGFVLLFNQPFPTGFENDRAFAVIFSSALLVTGLFLKLDQAQEKKRSN